MASKFRQKLIWDPYDVSYKKYLKAKSYIVILATCPASMTGKE